MNLKHEPVYYHYTEWEDYQNGMYSEKLDGGYDLRSHQAKELLADTDRLREAMLEVVISWPKATTQNMTATRINKRAWLGWSACNIECGATDTETKAGWRMLEQWQMDAANAVADEIIDEWGTTYEADNWEISIFGGEGANIMDVRHP